MSGYYFLKKFLQKRRLKKQRNANKLSSVIHHDYDDDVAKKDIDKCRLCMKEGDIPIFNRESTFDIAENIRTFGGIELSENDGLPKYICKTCHSFLNDALSFRKSVQDTDKKLREAISVQSNDFDDLNDVDDDINEAPEPITKSYNCKLCKLHFQSWSDYVAHKNSKNHKKVRIQCPICYGILTAQLYKRHLARHQTASHLICEICGKLYRKDNLVRHLQLHNYDLPYQCQVCPYRGRFMESLKIHMRTHTGDKPFTCDKCELRFLTRSNLNRHLLTHKKERPFKCVECGRGFYTKSEMDAHFKADHAGLKDFNCRMCGNKYGTRKALMRHELRVHKRDKMTKGRVPLYLQAEYQK